MVEEAHNLLDSTVIAKKTFNKLRKIQNEFRNLKMHMICVALRLQDLSPKIRSKMSILLSRVSLDDYQLKVRNLLRNSKYRDEITELPKGKFVFPELDLELTTEPFEHNGKPQEWYRPEQPKPELNLFGKILKAIFPAIFPQPKPQTQNRQIQQRKQTVKDLEEQSKENSEDDGLMSEGDMWFPEEM